jgi:hypothetical protein
MTTGLGGIDCDLPADVGHLRDLLREHHHEFDGFCAEQDAEAGEALPPTVGASHISRCRC